MEIKITVGELLTANEALRALLAVEMPTETGYAILRLVKQLTGEIEVALESRNKIITKYGKTDSLGETEIPLNELYKAAPELKKLEAIEVTVKVNPITLPRDIKTTPAVLFALEKFASQTK